MSIDKLHHHDQNLKSLQQNLLKICDEYQHAQKSLIDMKVQVRRACHQMNHSWSQVFSLVMLIDEIVDEMIDDVAPLEFEPKES